MPSPRSLLPLAAVAVAFLACAESGDAPADGVTGATSVAPPPVPEITDLSRRAADFRSGMTREETVAILGPADWAVVPADTGEYALPEGDFGLSLRWENGPDCGQVEALFDTDLTLTGWDEGRVCTGGLGRYHPSPHLSCSLDERAALCRAG